MLIVFKTPLSRHSDARMQVLKWRLDGFDCSRLRLSENHVYVSMDKFTGDVFGCSEIFVENRYLRQVSRLARWRRRSSRRRSGRRTLPADGGEGAASCCAGALRTSWSLLSRPGASSARAAAPAGSSGRPEQHRAGAAAAALLLWFCFGAVVSWVFWGFAVVFVFPYFKVKVRTL